MRTKTGAKRKKRVADNDQIEKFSDFGAARRDAERQGRIDRMAAMAMAQMVSMDPMRRPADVAKRAYDFAEALEAEREGGRDAQG